MDILMYSLIKSIKINKKLGQHFLISESIAELEGKYGRGKKVIEIGPGLGILTRKLCEKSKQVFAIEKDVRLFRILSSTLSCKNLKLINADFFNVDTKELRKYDIIISNIPYALSSKVLEWIIKNNFSAVLCLQKEFVERMLAKENTREYSRLSVMTSLTLGVERVYEVNAENFYPKPKVDSEIVHIHALKHNISNEENEIIKLIMTHKKKKLRNAIIDSSKALKISKDKAREIAGKMKYSKLRVFKLPALQILSSARELIKMLEALR